MKTLLAILIIIFLLIANGCSKKEEMPEKYVISQTMYYKPAQPEHLTSYFGMIGDSLMMKTIPEVPARYIVSTRLCNGMNGLELKVYESFNNIFSSDITVTNFDSLCIIKTNEFNKANDIKQILLKFEDCN